MAGNLQAGFSNDINLVTMRDSATTSKRYTDRTIDFDGDGTKEAVTETHVSGHAPVGGGKVRVTVEDVADFPAGLKNTVVSETDETDGGVNTAGTEFSEGT